MFNFKMYFFFVKMSVQCESSTDCGYDLGNLRSRSTVYISSKTYYTFFKSLLNVENMEGYTLFTKGPQLHIHFFILHV